MYNKGMRKIKNGIIKRLRKTKNIKPKSLGLDLHTEPKGDISENRCFTEQDLKSIELLGDRDIINSSLLEYDLDEYEGNIYALMEEGALSNIHTGAELGIYNYQELQDDLSTYSDFAVLDNYKSNKSDTFFDSDDIDQDYAFSHCILAEDNLAKSNQTELIYTFRGYLEVATSDKLYSIIRASEFDKSKISKVYIPQYFIKNYKLRNGDEIVCSCFKSQGKLMIDALFTINDIYYKDWNCERKWINNLKAVDFKDEIVSEHGYTDVIAKKFKLYKGDNIYVYINKNTQKAQVTNPLINNLSNLFDKVIYISPQYREANKIDSGYNIVKFCCGAGEKLEIQQSTALLAANYAKRLLELGQSVAMVIDDLDALMALDSCFGNETPICKTVLSAAKSTEQGAITSFTLMSMRSDVVNSIHSYNIFRSFETLGIVIDNGEIDLYNSYRI